MRCVSSNCVAEGKYVAKPRPGCDQSQCGAATRHSEAIWEGVAARFQRAVFRSFWTALLLFSLSGSHFVALQSISLQGFGLCHAFGDHNVFLLGLLFPDGLLGECYEFRPSPR